MEQARQRQDLLTKPRGSLGRLEELSVGLAGMQANPRPHIADKAIVTMAADHGVIAEGVSLYPQEVTRQMVLNFLAGGAAINVLGRQVGARVTIVDMGVAADLGECPSLVSRKIAPGTKNMARGPAMTRDQAVSAIEAGIHILQEEKNRGLDIVATGDMGIGNTTASTAICAAMTGSQPMEVVGPGTGLDDRRVTEKAGVIQRALDVNHPDSGDALDVLAKVGGFEIGGLAGVVLGAASLRVPVVIDGFVSGAAALIAVGLCPQARDYLIAAHLSSEPGHRAVLSHLGLEPLLDLGLHLGEGSGAALGIFLAETACRILDEMATFADAGVSGPEDGQ
jgi:nicotinate-nucleotide--dimethylbenzimidazole phosphoribosyltransferase